MSTAAQPVQAIRRHLRMFGSPVLTLTGQAVALGRRSRAILAYLELAPDRRARRERFCGLLWPERADEQARGSLRQCLKELRAAIGPSLGADREWIWLEPDALTSDRAAVEAAILALDTDGLRAALEAIGAEPLVDGMDLGQAFDDWLFTSRAAIERRIGEAVASITADAIGARDWSGALGLADAWLARDPLDERVAALAISAERLRGAPAAAERRLRQLTEALTRERLGAPGAAVTQALRDPIAIDADAIRTSPVSLVQGLGLNLPHKPSIAVLPFVDLASEASSDAFADGMVEEISVALSRFSSLFVIAGQSSLSYRGTDKPARVVATELGVRYLLEGSVRQAAGKVRISVKLVDATQNEQIWGERFDGEMADIFGLQDRVAAKVASRIDSTITDAEMHRAAIRHAPVPDAYELNLQANAKLNCYDRQSIQEAMELAEEAARLDPDYPWAVAIAGFCHAALYMNGWTDDPAATRARAKAHLDRAMRIGADDLMALPVTAGAILNIGGDLAQARRLLDRALELNSEKAFTLLWCGWLELLSDRPEVALERLEKALRLNPRSTYRPFELVGIGNCLFLLGRDEEAVIVQQEAVDIVPTFAPAHVVLAASLARLGRIEEARSALERWRRLGGRHELLVFRPVSQQRTLRDALSLLDAVDFQGRHAPHRIPLMAKG